MTVYRRPDPIPLRNNPVRADSTQLSAVRPDSEDLNRLVARRIFQAIIDGRFPSGSILPNEHQLSTELGVSRTALREAIKGLSSKGLVETRRKRGTLVLDQHQWNMLDGEIVSWSRRGGSDRVSAELWDSLRITHPQLAAEAAGRFSSGRLMDIARDLESATEQRSKAEGVVKAILEVARLSGNRFLSSLTRTAVGNLRADDEPFLLRTCRHVVSQDIAELAGRLSSGDIEGATRVASSMFASKTPAAIEDLAYQSD